MANQYGIEPIGTFSNGQTLPDSTTADSTTMVYVGGQSGGALMISVYARTAVSIATGQAFNIELEAFTSDAPTSAVSPFSADNSGSSPTAENDAHFYLLHKTSADNPLAFSAGDLITQCGVPFQLLDKLSYDYIQLKYTTDADESAETVDAFVHGIL